MVTVFIDERLYTYFVTRVTFNVAWPRHAQMYFHSAHDKRLFHETEKKRIAFLNPTFLWTLTALPPSTRGEKEKQLIIICAYKENTNKKCAHVNRNNSEVACQEASSFSFRTDHPIHILGFLLVNAISHLFAMEMRFFEITNPSIIISIEIASLLEPQKEVALFSQFNNCIFGREISIPRHIHISIMICS